MDVNIFCNFNRNVILSEGKYKCDFTPWYLVRPEVNGDMMDAVNAGQVYPPGCGLSPI